MPYVKKFTPTTDGHYQCPQCTQTFDRIHQLTGHMNGHRTRTPKPTHKAAPKKPQQNHGAPAPPALKYCPHCGCNLSVIAAALQFMAEKG